MIVPNPLNKQNKFKNLEVPIPLRNESGCKTYKNLLDIEPPSATTIATSGGNSQRQSRENLRNTYFQ